jgi:uncharacterized membrane protein
MKIVAVYLAVAVQFLLIDMVWFKVMCERMYRPILGDILRAGTQPMAAALFYSIHRLGLVGFAVMPAYHDESSVRALVAGLIFGCFTYATYDLTNQATLRNWTTMLTLTDVLWGSVLAACCSYCGYLMADRLLEMP